jgi:hypothetical protein
MRMNAPRLCGLALFWVSSGLLLSASSCIVPEPVPGQPLTAQQANILKQQKYQELGDNRRQNNRPCPPSSCK